MRNHQKTFTMLLVLVLIGLNMRPLLTSVGPLLPQLRQASGMSFSVAALLTALPVVTMGGLALAGSWLHQHVSERRSVAISLLLIAVGALMRELYPQSVLLLSSALLGGVGIGIIQAVMPSVIKRRFQQRTPLVMGLWSAALMGGGGLGAAITPWLVQHSETWYQTLAWWALPAVVALFAWWWQSAREVASSHKTTTTPVRVVFTPRAWTLGVYFGLINGGYASLIAWLPAFYIEIGASAQYSGSLLALMTLGQAAGALLMPCYGSPSGSAQTVNAGAGVTTGGVLRLYLVAAAIAGIVGDGVWVRSGRRVSALFAAGARSLCATGYCWQAGGVYAGNRFYHRRACPVVFWRAA